MARNKTDDKTASDDAFVEVESHDGSTFTFDLHLADRRVSFVDGKAMVSEETATLLRDAGHIV